MTEDRTEAKVRITLMFRSQLCNRLIFVAKYLMNVRITIIVYIM